MNSELLIILLLLCSAIVMLALNKPRVDAVALIPGLLSASATGWPSAALPASGACLCC